VPAEHVVRRVLQTVPLPQVSPRQRAGGPPVPVVPAVVSAGPVTGSQPAVSAEQGRQ
jgi:MoxR-like ATPase